MIRIAASLALIAALAACEATTETRGMQVAPPAVEPGEVVAPTQEALALFDRVCIQTGARPSAIAAALGDLPFERDPASNIYYHESYNLSFAIFPDACSIVLFSSNPRATGETLGRAANASGLRATVRPYDDNYVNVVVG